MLSSFAAEIILPERDNLKLYHVEIFDSRSGAMVLKFESASRKVPISDQLQGQFKMKISITDIWDRIVVSPDLIDLDLGTVEAMKVLISPWLAYEFVNLKTYFDSLQNNSSFNLLTIGLDTSIKKTDTMGVSTKFSSSIPGKNQYTAFDLSPYYTFAWRSTDIRLGVKWLYQKFMLISEAGDTDSSTSSLGVYTRFLFDSDLLFDLFTPSIEVNFSKGIRQVSFQIEYTGKIFKNYSIRPFIGLDDLEIKQGSNYSKRQSIIIGLKMDII